MLCAMQHNHGRQNIRLGKKERVTLSTHCNAEQILNDVYDNAKDVSNVLIKHGSTQMHDCIIDFVIFIKKGYVPLPRSVDIRDVMSVCGEVSINCYAET